MTNRSQSRGRATRGGYPGSAPAAPPKRPEGPGASFNPPATPDLVRDAIDDFLWLGNNMHNYGTVLFKELLKAAIDDARRAKESLA